MVRVERVQTRDELVRRVSEGAGVIAGGTDYVPLYRAGSVSDVSAVDLTGVPELAGVSVGPAAVQIGAVTRLRDVMSLGEPCWRAVSDGAELVGSVQTRNRATLGGNLCRASPSGDTLPALLVCDAVLTIGSQGGRREVSVDEFFIGPGLTTLLAGEVLEAISLPRLPGGSSYRRATVRRAMDLATVGVAVHVGVRAGQVTDLRLAIGGAGPRPILVRDVAGFGSGKAVADLDIIAEGLNERAQDAISPIDDVRGSAWYRRRLVTALIGRSLRQAVERCQGAR